MPKTLRTPTSPLVLAAVVFGVAAIVRLVYVCGFHSPQNFVSSDMWVYDHRARHLLSGDSGAWDTFTPVGYPALVAVVYALGGSAAFIGVLQALLGAGTAALTSLLALRSFGRPALALALGLLCALHLPGVLYTGFLLTETLCAFLVVSACWALAWSRERGSLLGWAALGLVLGCAITVRPNLLLFMPSLPVLLWLGCDRRWRRSLAALGVALAAFALPVGAAAVRNSHLLGRPASLGTNGGLNFYLNFAEVRGVRFSDRLGTHRITPIPNLRRYPRDEDEEQVRVPFYDDAHYYGRGLALLRERPERLLRVASNVVEAAGVGVQGYWPVPETRLTRGHRRVFFGAALLPSVAGVLLLARRRRWSARENLPLCAAAALILSNLVTVMLFLGDPRMRVPFDPLVMLLAAAGYLWVGEALQARRAPAGR
jgi:4-amino-4-deoxy-L-arabinose transferase-like glycosyltransferase